MLCCLCFFFFKQKTAYEMRISDWSSDCALPIFDAHAEGDGGDDHHILRTDEGGLVARPNAGIETGMVGKHLAPGSAESLGQLLGLVTAGRSKERRVGKECVSTCRSRWSQYH